MAEKPSLYLDSKLFYHPVRDQRGKSLTVPDPQLEEIEPDDDSKLSTKKAVETLKSLSAVLRKAGAAQESGDSAAPMSQGQRKREYAHSFMREGRGISGGATPDLPERGKDWHGTVPGVKDEPQDGMEEQKKLDRPPVNLVDSKPDVDSADDDNAAARKALSGAPLFNPGHVAPPREKEFLQLRGWSNEDIESGQASMSPRLRAEFNKWLTSTVQKSISSFSKSLG